MVNLGERGGKQLSPELLAQLLGVNNLNNAPKPGNVNLNSRDYASLLLNGQPGNVQGGYSGDPKTGLTELMGRGIGADPVQNQIMEAIKRKQLDMRSQTEKPSSVDLGGSSFTGEGDITPLQMPNYDPNAFRGQAKSMVDSQYNPIIQALMAEQGTAKTRAKSVQGDISALFGNLGQAFGEQTGQNYQGFEQAEAANKNVYSDQRDELAKIYAQSAADQQKQAGSLGTGQLGVEQGLAQQQTDQQFNQGAAQNQMAAEQAALNLQQQGQLGFDKAQTNAAFTEGASRQSDIATQLADFLGQSNMKVADTRSQAAGSMNDLMMQLANASYDRDAANTQFQYQQQRDQIGDANSLAQYDMESQKAMLDNQMAQQKLQQDNTKLNPWQQVGTFAEQLQQGSGSNIVSALQQAMQSNPEIYAPDPEGVRMNPARFAKLVVDSAGGDNVDQNALAMAAQELYRLLYGTG